jgi:serine/threonine-protein kinase
MSEQDPQPSPEPIAPAQPAPEPATLMPTEAAPTQNPLQPAPVAAGKAAEQATTMPAPTAATPLEDALRSASFANQVWGDFEIGQLIGCGGMGAVYRGRQISLDRPVAIKVLGKHLSDNDSFRQRFLREARAVAQISSPHVVQIHSAGVHEGHHFFVMELVDGIDLARKLKEGFRPSNAAAFDLVLQAARGLAAAGRLGIVHRDIKPANMLITRDGVLKLSDFGLVKLVSEGRGKTTESGLTGTGIIVGTAGYFSPEQGLGERCDQRTDLYALGVVAYELLTGKLPFTASDTTSIIYQHVHEAPRPVRQLNPSVHPELDAVVMRCLAKKPDQRYQTAPELVAELERLAIAGRISDHGGSPRLMRWMTAAGLALALIGGASAYGLSRRHPLPAQQPDPAAEPRHQSLADVAGQSEPFPAAATNQPPPSHSESQALLQAASDPPEPAEPPVAASKPVLAPEPAQPTTPEPTKPTPEPAKAPPEPAKPAVVVASVAPAKPADADDKSKTRSFAPAPTELVEPPPEEPKPVAAEVVKVAVAPAPTPNAERRTPNPSAKPEIVPDDDPTAVVIAKPLPPAEPAREPHRDDYGRYADLSLLGLTQRFRWCPPGRFNMGSPDAESRRGRDEDIHQVTLTHGFWLADCECTQALWQAVMGYDPSAVQDLDHPVEQVSWQQTQEFVRRINALAPGLKARLPSEAEWEYAARAGASGPTPVALDAHAWYSRTGQGTTHPVRQLRPNAWGLFDCLGNVAEWCQDAYGEYEKPVSVDPIPTGTGGPVFRGGSFRDGAGDCRAAHREHARAAMTSDRVGFRLAADAVPGEGE